MAAKQTVSSFAGALVAVVVAALVAWAGSWGGATVGSVPVFAIVVGYAFVVQWLAFIPSYLLRTERFYDLSGAFTFISVIRDSVHNVANNPRWATSNWADTWLGA
jgi:hypothetical protein